jgi:acyl carrier protein
MNTFDIQRVVVETVASVLKKEATEIDERVLFSELGTDELDMFELILKIEDEFRLEISDDDAQKLCNVEQVVTYIAARRAE